MSSLSFCSLLFSLATSVFLTFSSLHCLCSDFYNLFQVVRGPAASTVTLLPQQEWRLSPPSLLLPPHPVQYFSLLLPVRRQVHLKTSQSREINDVITALPALASLFYSLCVPPVCSWRAQSVPSLPSSFPAPHSSFSVPQTPPAPRQPTAQLGSVGESTSVLTKPSSLPSAPDSGTGAGGGAGGATASFLASQCLFTGVFLSL